MKEFYPSISEDILTDAIQFAKLYTSIDDKDLCLIMHCRNRNKILPDGCENMKLRVAIN